MTKYMQNKACFYRTILAVSYLVTIFWLGLIYYLSGQVAEVSNQLSIGLTEKIISLLKKILPQSKLEAADLNHFMRKNAHFIAYLLLGVFSGNSLFLSWLYARPGSSLANWPRSRIWLASWLFCLAYAVTDELHQYFVPGRACQMRDILLDSAGAAVGILLYLALYHLFKRKKRVRSV